MIYQKTDVEAVAQNLRDAGCTEDFIVTFLHAWEDGTPAEQLRLLSGQRRSLLDTIHAQQKKLDAWTICAISWKRSREPSNIEI